MYLVNLIKVCTNLMTNNHTNYSTSSTRKWMARTKICTSCSTTDVRRNLRIKSYPSQNHAPGRYEATSSAMRCWSATTADASNAGASRQRLVSARCHASGSQDKLPTGGGAVSEEPGDCTP